MDHVCGTNFGGEKMAEDSLLIEAWRDQESLWNAQSLHYHHRDRRREAMQTITTKMNEAGFSCTEDHIRKRLASLRTQYTKELGKYLKSHKSGASIDDVAIPKWRWFKMLDAFLRPFCTVRKGINTIEGTQQINTAEEDESNYIANDIELLLNNTQSQSTMDDTEPDENSQSLLSATSRSSRPLSSVTSTPSITCSPAASTSHSNGSSLMRNSTGTAPQKRKKSGDVRQDACNLLSAIAQKTLDKTPKSANYGFATYVMQELDQLSLPQQKRAKLKISQILFDFGIEDEV